MKMATSWYAKQPVIGFCSANFNNSNINKKIRTFVCYRHLLMIILVFDR